MDDLLKQEVELLKTCAYSQNPRRSAPARLLSRGSRTHTLDSLFCSRGRTHTLGSEIFRINHHQSIRSFVVWVYLPTDHLCKPKPPTASAFLSPGASYS
jgi:hypothetical protein